MRDRGATRALVLGVLALPFGILAPFAVLSGARSLYRIRASHGELAGSAAAAGGLVAGSIALASLIAGVVYWLVASS